MLRAILGSATPWRPTAFRKTRPWLGRAISCRCREPQSFARSGRAVPIVRTPSSRATILMALGALDELRERDVRVPHDVLLTGFDDSPTAKLASPSLTTVRQPLASLLGIALTMVLDQVEGREAPRVTSVGVELVTRQSCGCGYRVTGPRPNAVSVPRGLLGNRAPSAVITERWQSLLEALVNAVRIPRRAVGGWPMRMLTALANDVGGEDGTFLAELERMLEEAQRDGYVLEEFLTAVWVLRAEVGPEITVGITSLENLWHAANMLVGAAVAREQGRARLELQVTAERVSRGLERVSTSLSHEALRTALLEFLPTARVKSAAVSLFAEGHADTQLRHLFAMVMERPAPVSYTQFPATELAPSSLFTDSLRTSYIVMPLTFAEQHLGVGLFSSGALWLVYAVLRDQISAALVGTRLHEEVVRETEAHKRAERERMDREVVIARQIQTTLVPRLPMAHGYDVAATMMPAVDVGGDYFDVLPQTDCSWVGIGDVTGHGLVASLIMMMLQSMIAALIQRDPTSSPSAILCRLNAVLFDNVHGRLGRDNHATLCLLRLDTDGRVTHAGAHEEIVVRRARTGRCERLPTGGVWVGATHDVAGLMYDTSFVLEPEDTMVLYTDGLTEAMDARHDPFGIERIVELVECRPQASAAELCEALIVAGQSFSSLQRDNITVVVARYCSPTSHAPSTHVVPPSQVMPQSPQF